MATPYESGGKRPRLARTTDLLARRRTSGPAVTRRRVSHFLVNSRKANTKNLNH